MYYIYLYRGIQGNLTLYWDIIPNTGLLFQRNKGSIVVPLQKTDI